MPSDTLAEDRCAVASPVLPFQRHDCGQHQRNHLMLLLKVGVMFGGKGDEPKTQRSFISLFSKSMSSSLPAACARPK